jgi:hypothetical protein
MPLNEIEVAGSSISMQVCHTSFDPEEVYDRIMKEDELFNIENETPGFHDVDFDSGLLRGYYSGIVPFEVEHLVDGNAKRELFKRIESAEFVSDGEFVFAWGKGGPIKGLAMNLSGLSGSECGYAAFEFNDLFNIQNRMAKLKSITVKNPKECEVRTCRLSGGIEEYTTFNVVNNNHGINSVSGLITTPMGSMTLTATQKGNIRLGVARGMIINFDLLTWIVKLIYGKVCEKKSF